MEQPIFKTAYTFDDVILEPQYSEVVADEVHPHSQLTSTITLPTPICSAAMDTVTEAIMAIAIANQGGIGFIHRRSSIEKQVQEVQKVKQAEVIDAAIANIDHSNKLRVAAAIGVGEKTIFQLIRGLRSGMGYLGAQTIQQLQENAVFLQVTAASLQEAHPHSINITNRGPNY